MAPSKEGDNSMDSSLFYVHSEQLTKLLTASAGDDEPVPKTSINLEKPMLPGSVKEQHLPSHRNTSQHENPCY